MNIRSLSTLVLAAAMAATSSLASAQSSRPVRSTQGKASADLLDRAVAAWAKVRTARATFEQTITNPLTGRTMTSTGELQQQRPGKLSLRFTDPANDRIVADGTHLWVYLPSTAPGQVLRTSARGANGVTTDFTDQFLTAPRSRYTVTNAGAQTVGGRASRGFTLVPRTAEGGPFQTATVWIDEADATIRQVAITEANGVQRTVRLTSFRPNVPVDASAFRFTVPQGMRVIEQ